MKRTIIISLLSLLSFCLHAQVVEGSMVSAKDSTIVNPEVFAIVDSSLVGQNIFECMPSRFKADNGNVTIRQSAEIRHAMQEKINAGQFKMVPGYRVRIFFSNAQDAREKAAQTVEMFREKFGTYSVYLSYVNPNFKVTAGDFRSKSEALELLNTVKRDFPSAFVVKENITLLY